jgi:hypothetical protein
MSSPLIIIVVIAHGAITIVITVAARRAVTIIIVVITRRAVAITIIVIVKVVARRPSSSRSLPVTPPIVMPLPLLSLSSPNAPPKLLAKLC